MASIESDKTGMVVLAKLRHADEMRGGWFAAAKEADEAFKNRRGQEDFQRTVTHPKIYAAIHADGTAVPPRPTVRPNRPEGFSTRATELHNRQELFPPHRRKCTHHRRLRGRSTSHSHNRSRD